jgi:hypothetical protein
VLRIIRLAATKNNISVLLRLLGYPADLPNLTRKRPPAGNTRPEGIHNSLPETPPRRTGVIYSGFAMGSMWCDHGERRSSSRKRSFLGGMATSPSREKLVLLPDEPETAAGQHFFRLAPPRRVN